LQRRAQVERLPRLSGGPFRIEAFANGNVIRSFSVGAGDVVTIDDDTVTGLRLTAEDGLPLDTPDRFALRGNYPNPFNPTTNLVFDMPSTGVVRVDVFDLLGRRVMSLPAQEVAAGAARQMILDASSLASGTYLYHLQVEAAGEASVQVGRMTLLK
jgi:hypothetical protein